jgi:hypothetical protein
MEKHVGFHFVISAKHRWINRKIMQESPQVTKKYVTNEVYLPPKTGYCVTFFAYSSANFFLSSVSPATLEPSSRAPATY